MNVQQRALKCRALKSVARVPSRSLSVVPSQEVLHGEVGPPFHLEALRAFTAAEFMEENIDFLSEVMESEVIKQCVFASRAR